MKKAFAYLLFLLTLTPVYGQDVVTATIEGASEMTFGPTPDKAHRNRYTLKLLDAKGQPVSAEDFKAQATSYRVWWSIDGFKTENDLKGQYCDSYGRFSVNGKGKLSTTFDLRNVPMNFKGTMKAKLTYNGKTIVAEKQVEAIGDRSEVPALREQVGEEAFLKVEKGNFYELTVTYQGVLSTGSVNADLKGYTLGTHPELTTETYLIPATMDEIDLHVAANDAIQVAQLKDYTIAKQAKRKPRQKRRVHQIGDSTAANKGSWARTLAGRAEKGQYAELTDLCEFKSRGAGGRNLSTYYNEGKLYSVLKDIYPGDIVMFGNNGTNGMKKCFEDDVNYYLDACELLGAQVIINSYTPHGAVGKFANGYDAATHTFDSYRKDTYDNIVRKVAEQRAASDKNYLGFVEIGRHADAAFNAYVADYAKNGHASADEAAQAIVKCFSDHNHYSKSPLACDLMLNGYGDVKGIVTQLTELLKK